MRTQCYDISKYLLFTALIISVISCKNSTEKPTTPSGDTIEISEEKGMNIIVDDPENEGSKMLLGPVTKKGFNNDTFFPWMATEYSSYEPDTEILAQLKTAINGVSIKVFMGTWCEDSQREFPRMYAILNRIDYEATDIEIVAVSHNKDTPSGLEKGMNIEYVPTFIFYKNGRALGRFVEYAQNSLEKDMLDIITGVPYKHAYEN